MNDNIISRFDRSGVPLILDGAMGSLLQMNGITADRKRWMTDANTENPDAVLKIHQDYIAAGADIITANTFRTNPAALGFHDQHEVNRQVTAAVSLAQRARGSLDIIIAGSNAPAEDCYQSERQLSLHQLEQNHSEHIDLLISSGCDFVLNETQSHLDEIGFICSYCHLNDIPFVMSLYFTHELKILSGEDIRDVVKFVQNYNPAAIGFNCITPEDMINLVRTVQIDFRWGYYLNTGCGDVNSKNISCGIDAGSFIQTVKILDAYSPCFVGACCGSDSKHIQSLKEHYYGIS